MNSTTGRGARERRDRGGTHRCAVTAVTRLTPRMIRTSLAGPGLVGLEPAGPDQRVKLAFPQGRTFGDDPEEMSRARRRRRTYTLLHLDPRAGTAEVDFVLHGGGLAGEWAAHAQMGDEVALTTPVGRFEAGHTPWLLLACDETGLPALREILTGLEAGRRVRAYVEVHDDAERQQLPCAADLEVTWLTRADTGAEPGALLAALADDVTCDAPQTSAWIAGESEAVRRLRTALVTRVGLDRKRVAAVAYWQAGRAEGEPAAGRPAPRGRDS